MNTNLTPTNLTPTALTDTAADIANAIRPQRLLCDKDVMPRTTTVLSLHAQAEIETAATWANKYGKLADRAKAKYGLIDIVNVTHPVNTGAEVDGSDATDNRPTQPKECNYCRRMGGVVPTVIGIDTHFLHPRCVEKYKRQVLGMKGARREAVTI